MSFVAEKKLSPKDLAEKFVAKAAEYGFGWFASGNVVKVWKKMDLSDPMAFAKAETEAGILLYDICPLKGGSVWGTDGGSIGGAVAMQTGMFKLNKSGSGKAFMNALSKHGKPSPWAIN